MSERVDRSELQAGRWYVVLQGSVQRPMRLVAWTSTTQLIMETRGGKETTVSIFRVIEGWDPGRGQKLLLRKAGEPDKATVVDERPRGKHKRHKVHANSIRSWRELDTSDRERDICSILVGLGPLTDRQICKALNKSDLNYVRPSITRMRDAGAIIEVGKIKCPNTGRQVRLNGLRGLHDRELSA